MIHVHFLINKLDIEHIIALGGKKSNEKLGKKGNRCNCSRVGTFGTESAVRKRGGSRNLPYLDAKPRQIPLLGMYA